MGGMQTLLHKARMLSGQGPEQVRRERARAPAVRTVLLYGAPRTGKSALVRAVAAEAGAALFDLSPRATDGKYPGKAAALMIHMVREARARARAACRGWRRSCPAGHMGHIAALEMPRSRSGARLGAQACVGLDRCDRLACARCWDATACRHAAAGVQGGQGAGAVRDLH